MSRSATDVPVPIPDNNPTGATSTIAVSDPRIVQDVDVTVNVTHTYDGDLTLSLLTPAGGTVTLSARRGGSGDHFRNTTFDDEAPTAISAGSAPFTGSFRPETPLSVADGLPASGNWRFRVVDQAAQDVGTIDSFTLVLTHPPEACAPSGAPPPVPEGGAGPAMTASRENGAGSAIRVRWDASSCPAMNYHLLWGPLASVSSLALSGADCGLGPVGAYTWSGVDPGDLWFVVVGNDAASTEGTWGIDGSGGERGGSAASGRCGFAARNNGGMCP